MKPPACYLNRGVGRLEAFDWAADRLDELRTRIAESALPFGIHTPLLRPTDYPHGPEAVFYLNDDPAERERAWQMLDATLAHARDWGAEYAVTHLAWGQDCTDEERALALAERAGTGLASAARAAGVPILVETGGYTGHFHRAAQYAELAASDPWLGLCIDIGHSRLVAETRGRSPWDDLEVLAAQARSMHLWNTRGLEHYREHHHTPLHPTQRPADGWIDVERALEVVLRTNPRCALIFEYTWEERDAAWVEEGFAWVEAIARRYR